MGRLRPACLVERLARVRRAPSWWRCYAALAPLLELDPTAGEGLGALPALADGGTVHARDPGRAIVLRHPHAAAGVSARRK